MQLQLNILNPCLSLFHNITGTELIDDAAVKNCNTRFTELISDDLDKICVNGTKEKRFVFETAMLIAVATTAIVAGDAVFIENPKFEAKVNAMQGKINELVRSHDQSLNEIQALRSTVVAIARTTSTALKQLQDEVEFLGNITQAQPALSDLVGITYAKFARASNLIEAARKKIVNQKIVPIELFELFNGSHLYDPIMERLSIYTSCKRQDKLKLNFVFTTFAKSEDIKIYKANPFEFYNKSENTVCLNTYQGPEFVMFNQTADCMTPIDSKVIDNNAIRGLSCSQRTRLTPNKLEWKVSDCQNESNTTRTLREIKHHEYFHYFNCQGNTINFNHEQAKCPDFVFSIPDSESFNIGDYYYSHTATNLMSKTQLESTAPARINLQLGISGLHFGVENTIQNLSAVPVAARVTELKNDTITTNLFQDTEKIFKSSKLATWYETTKDYFNTAVNVGYAMFFVAVFLVLKPIIIFTIWLASKPLNSLWRRSEWKLPVTIDRSNDRTRLGWHRPVTMRRKTK